MAMTEREWQKMVKRWARDLGWRVFHCTYSIGSEPGFPDLVLVRPPRFLIRELKSDKGKLSEAQEDWIEDLTSCGIDAGVWRPSDEQLVLGELR